MKKNECKIQFNVLVQTKMPNKKIRRGRFERDIEDVMTDVYVQYIKHLVSKIPNSDKYTWEPKGKNLRLVVPK